MTTKIISQQVIVVIVVVIVVLISSRCLYVLYWSCVSPRLLTSTIAIYPHPWVCLVLTALAVFVVGSVSSFVVPVEVGTEIPSAVAAEAAPVLLPLA